MSHFSVLVVGDVDYNMAPFHEFECDGIDDEFVQTIDVTERYRKDYLKALEEQKTNPDQKYGFKGKTFREYIEDYCGMHFAESRRKLNLKDGEHHKFGYFIPVEGTEDDFKVYDRTNPNKFYDYYGSGYRGFRLKVKSADEEPKYVNEAYKGDIDFEAMWAEKEQAARELHRKVIKILGGIPVLEHPWSSLVDKFHPEEGEPVMTRDEAIEIYRAQPAVVAFEKAKEEKKLTYEDVGFFSSVDEFTMSEDDYVTSQHVHCLTFGFVKDRKYASEGDMGWWAIVTDEKDPTAWDKEYKEFIESLDDDDFLSILDCHI